MYHLQTIPPHHLHARGRGQTKHQAYATSRRGPGPGHPAATTKPACDRAGEHGQGASCWSTFGRALTKGAVTRPHHHPLANAHVPAGGQPSPSPAEGAWLHPRKQAGGSGVAASSRSRGQGAMLNEVAGDPAQEQGAGLLAASTGSAVKRSGRGSWGSAGARRPSVLTSRLACQGPESTQRRKCLGLAGRGSYVPWSRAGAIPYAAGAHTAARLREATLVLRRRGAGVCASGSGLTASVLCARGAGMALVL